MKADWVRALSQDLMRAIAASGSDSTLLPSASRSRARRFFSFALAPGVCLEAGFHGTFWPRGWRYSGSGASEPIARYMMRLDCGTVTSSALSRRRPQRAAAQHAHFKNLPLVQWGAQLAHGPQKEPRHCFLSGQEPDRLRTIRSRIKDIVCAYGDTHFGGCGLRLRR